MPDNESPAANPKLLHTIGILIAIIATIAQGVYTFAVISTRLDTHIKSPAIHEPAANKTTRIRTEIAIAQRVIDLRLDRLEARLDADEAAIKTLEHTP